MCLFKYIGYSLYVESVCLNRRTCRGNFYFYRGFIKFVSGDGTMQGMGVNGMSMEG